MRVLVVGGGGREHAIAWKLRQSKLVTEVFCAPGNAGTKDIATNVELSALSIGALALWALENKIDLTVVGPEAPLAEGLVDIFTEHGLRVFGPTKAAARLEWSKSFAKEIMLKAGVKTAAAEIFDDCQKAREYVLERGAPIVIKADGLAAGKGVKVAMTVEQALSAIEEAMLAQTFGSSGSRVVIEEYIDGREASVMAIVDGTTVLPLVVSQDYKRLHDNGQGPNTGGMGAISPTPVLLDRAVENLVADIFIPTLQELQLRGIRYVGFLYAGIIVDKNGDFRVLEFNCRLGDPEAQVLLPRLKSDLAETLDAAVDGRLSSIELQWKPEAAVCVVACSRGYPGEVDDGKEISGLFDEEESVLVFQAGTKEENGGIFSKGGRILAVSALGASTEEAAKKAYQGIERISFDGMHFRKDIGVQ